MSETLSTATCPKCQQEVEDFDGFGVLFHDDCGYCAHTDLYGGVCRGCGQRPDRFTEGEGWVSYVV